MGVFTHADQALEWRGGHEIVRVEPWGPGSLRVRGTVWEEIRDDLPGALLPAEPVPVTVEIGADAARIGERFYGLGQHQHGRLDQKGAVVELIQRNTEVSIPFLLSSRCYGLLWNHPGVGRVELGTTATRWVSESTRQWDYWITAADEPAALVRGYAQAVGRTPMLPEWASGFWQCKLRYKTQDELLSVAREYKRRGLPL